MRTLFLWWLAVQCIATTRGWAWASTDQVAWPGKAVEQREGWHAGALSVINDPTRTTGWNPWFSELPNDVNHYGFEPRTTGEVQRLIEKVAAITGAVVRLSPGHEAVWSGWGGKSQWSRKTAVVFSLGNQKVLDDWFQRLPHTNGVRKFGVHQYAKVPSAMPPTLVIYVGHPAIDLDQLKLSEKVNVVAEPMGKTTSEAEERTSERIDAYLKRHRNREK